jgi:hypothetical protein
VATVDLGLPSVNVPRVAANFLTIGPRHFAVKRLIAFALKIFATVSRHLPRRPKTAAQELEEYTHPQPLPQAPGMANARAYFDATIDDAVRTFLPSFSLASPFASTVFPTRSISFAFLFSVKLPASE